MTRVVTLPAWLFMLMAGLIILNAVAWGLIATFGAVIIGG